MRLGPEAMEALQAEITGKLKTGDDLVVAGPVGLEGTIQIIKEREEFLKQYFSTGFLYELIRLEPEIRGKWEGEVFLQPYGKWQRFHR